MRHLGSCIAMCVIAGLGLGCAPSSSRQTVDVESATSKGVCLVQFLAGYVETVPLDQAQHGRRIQVKNVSALWGWGRVSPDGTHVGLLRRICGSLINDSGGLVFRSSEGTRR